MDLTRNDYQRNSTWSAPYTFSGKEKDAETGYGYFGARYYDSGLSIWLSVDPMSDKYPSMSPYNYCANNPVILVDPDGNRIICCNSISSKMVKQYLNEQFGKGSPFKVNRSGEVVVNQRKYNKYLNTCNPEQKILATGMFDAIGRNEICYVNIREFNSAESKYSFYFNPRYNENTQKNDYDEVNVRSGDSDGGTTPQKLFPGCFFVFMTDEKAKSLGMSTGKFKNTRTLGKDDYIGETYQLFTTPSPSANFIHEVLDEFLNFFTTHTVNENSPQIDKVYYQNAALRNLGSLERDALDHIK